MTKQELIGKVQRVEQLKAQAEWIGEAADTLSRLDRAGSLTFQENQDIVEMQIKLKKLRGTRLAAAGELFVEVMEDAHSAKA